MRQKHLEKKKECECAQEAPGLYINGWSEQHLEVSGPEFKQEQSRFNFKCEDVSINLVRWSGTKIHKHVFKVKSDKVTSNLRKTSRFSFVNDLISQRAGLAVMTWLQCTVTHCWPACEFSLTSHLEGNESC